MDSPTSIFKLTLYHLRAAQEKTRYTAASVFLSSSVNLAAGPHHSTVRRAACHTTIDSLAFARSTLSRGEPLDFAAGERRGRMAKDTAAYSPSPWLSFAKIRSGSEFVDVRAVAGHATRDACAYAAGRCASVSDVRAQRPPPRASRPAPPGGHPRSSRSALSCR